MMPLRKGILRMGPVIWLIIAVVLAVVEIGTVALVSVWLVFGALAGMVCAMLELELWVQILAFVIVSAVLLICTRPLVKKFLLTKETRTNADRLLEENGVVLETINNLLPSGQVKVLGQIWTARSEDGSVIEEGALVEVKKISGVKLIVKKARES